MSHRTIDRRHSALVDQYGRALPATTGRRGPQSGFGLYPTPRYAGSDNYRPRPYLTQGTQRGLSPFDRWELMNYSRQLFTQLGNLGSAIIQKNLWSVGDGWDPVFVGSNQKWGDQATEWLKEQFYPTCDIRGEPYDFKTALYLSGISWDVDGDDAMILTETDTGFPQLRLVPSHLIGNQTNESEIKGGPFSGARQYDGVIFNRDNRAIGYRIQDGDDSEKSQDVSAFNCQMMYEPEWKDQGRGIPRPARSILDWFDVQDIDVFLKRGVKLDASQGIMAYNEEGEALDGSETISADEVLINGLASNDTRTDPLVPGRPLQMQPINGGEYMYFRSNSGDKLESFKSDRPHPNTEAFIQRIERRGLLAVGWFYDLLDLTNISGAPSRLLKDLAMMAIRSRQINLRRRAKRAVVYAICKAMKNRKLPRNDDLANGILDASRWDFEMPGEISIDTGNDRAADREDLKMGISNLQTILSKNGLGSYLKFTRQTQREILNWAELSAEVETLTKGKISFKEAFVLFSQRNPNPQQPPQPEAGGDDDQDPPAKKEKAKP